MKGKVNSVSGDNIKFIEKEYDSATIYNEGDTALIRGVLYSCLVNNTTGTLNMDRWKRVYLSDLAEVTSSEQALADMVDEVYDPSKTYNKGDTALYNEVLHICKNDGTTGKWNADLWEQTTLVSILNSNLINEKSGTATCDTNGWYDITLGKKPIAFIVYFHTDSPDVKFSWIGNNPNDFIMNQYLYSDVLTEKDNSKRNAVVITDTGFSVKYSGYNASKTISWWAIF